MDYAMPVWAGTDEWNQGRGFWTKRKRSATSLVTILAVLSGIAVGFKLFDAEVPNNVVRDASTFDYLIEKRETEQGETDFTPANGANPIFATSAGQYPGDSRTVQVRITNTNVPERDATFYTYVNSISVVDGNGNVVGTADLRRARFISFFTLRVRRAALGNHVNTGQFSTACESGFNELTNQAPCEMGLVKASGSQNTAGQSTDQRLFEFTATEVDDGTDQSEFKGWEIRFTLVFQARVPAVPETSLL